jgi:predicted GNAT family N-acyltransferase
MNAHAGRVTRVAQPLISLPAPAAKHHLGKLNTARVAQRLVVFTPTAEDIDSLLPQARAVMGGGAETEVVHRVFRHNPDSIWAIARRENFAAGVTRGEGYVAYLMLNQAGVDSLFDGTFQATDPDLSLICGQNEIPVAIYVWGIYARGVIAGGLPLTYEKICTPRYRELPLYARAATPEGCRILESLGFILGATNGGKFLPQIHMFERGKPARPPAPLYDTYMPNGANDSVGITVARSFEDLFRVMSVRSAVYVGEQRCPYDEEFDGNDLTGANLLGYVGDEPVGCLRVRFFANFAKLERLAVRREFRNLHLGTALMRAGVEFCRAKGYRMIYGRAEKNLLDYYVGMGWRPLEGARRIVFSDHEYIEIVFEANPSPAAISLKTDPYVLMRPEGRWHLPGVLERSAVRSPARATVELDAIRPVGRRIAEKTRERIRA